MPLTNSCSRENMYYGLNPGMDYFLLITNKMVFFNLIKFSQKKRHFVKDLMSEQFCFDSSLTSGPNPVVKTCR